LLPDRRTNLLAQWDLLNRHRGWIPLYSGRESSIPPPCEKVVFTDGTVPGELQAEEDDNHRNGDARIQTSGENVIIFRPPTEVTATDNILRGRIDQLNRGDGGGSTNLEDVSDDCPWDEVEGSCWGDETCSGKEYREVDVSCPGIRESASDHPWNNGKDCANEEEEHKRAERIQYKRMLTGVELMNLLVNLTMRELTLRANNTPNDTRGSKHLCAQAEESILLVRTANSVNVREHPFLDAELGGTSNDGSKDLRPEHGAWWDLHVMTKLEVGGERESLHHGDVPPGLEQHHRNGTTW